MKFIRSLSCSSALLLIATLSVSTKSVVGRSVSLFVPKTFSMIQENNNKLNDYNDNNNSCIIDNLLLHEKLRGGASRRKPKRSKTASLSSSSSSPSEKTATGKKKVGAKKKETKKSQIGSLKTKYISTPILTRIYLTMIGISTLLGLLLGEELSQSLFALDPMRVLYGFEIWRPITAATFLGKPSIGWLFSGYYLYQYGTSLENAFGTAQHLIFLLTSISLLSVASALFGMPFITNSVTTSMLHVLSRAMPHQKVGWLIFQIPYWSLPYGFMASDVLQAGNLSAALPHVLGILAGHFYQFHKYVWPRMGGEDWLAAPDFLVSLLDKDAKKDLAKESINKAIKERKRSKGKKLGSKK